jgi:hypothetical protein
MSKNTEQESYPRLLGATVDEVLNAQEHAKTLSLEQTRELAQQLVDSHTHDPNFLPGSIERLAAFLTNDSIFSSPEDHTHGIEEVKTEVALFSTNSPYAEVRAVVDPTMTPIP